MKRSPGWLTCTGKPEDTRVALRKKIGFALRANFACKPAPLSNLLVLSQDCHEAPLNLHLTRMDNDRLQRCIRGLEPDLISGFPVESLQSRFVAGHQCYDDIAVVCIGHFLQQDQIAIAD